MAAAELQAAALLLWGVQADHAAIAALRAWQGKHLCTDSTRANAGTRLQRVCGMLPARRLAVAE
jgi:hypothetical protein